MATTYSDEFKEKMVHLYNAGKTITELSRDYGVSKSALSKWIKFFNSSGSFREADNHGRIIKQIYGNGTSTTYDYDQWLSGAGRLMTLNTKKRNDEFLQELSYSYDPIGNITQLNNMGETLNFSYDALSRLTGVSGAYEENYEYDPDTGNLKKKTGIEGDYHYGRAGAHAVTGYGTKKNVYEYDANGLMTKRKGMEITYDGQGHLTSYNGKNHIYDGDGNRVLMDHGEGSVTVYIGNYYEKHISRVDVIGPGDPPILSAESYPMYFPVLGNGETVDYETHRGQTYYYAGSSRIALRTIDGEVIWLYGDHLGSTSVTADRHGNELSRTKYHAWGSTWSSTSQTQTDYAYTGQMQVGDIYYYNARWYDPTIGRFMQADTIVPTHQGTQGFDRYAYVNNNPIIYQDENGHWINIVIGGLVGAVLNVGLYTVNTLINNKDFNWGHAALAAGTGLIGGALIGSGVGTSAGVSILQGSSTALIAATGIGIEVGSISYLGTNIIGNEDFDSMEFAISCTTEMMSAQLGVGLPGYSQMLLGGADEMLEYSLSSMNRGKKINPKELAINGGIGMVGEGLASSFNAGNIISEIGINSAFEISQNIVGNWLTSRLVSVNKPFLETRRIYNNPSRGIMETLESIR
jgi:RHS repeat-associated protein